MKHVLIVALLLSACGGAVASGETGETSARIDGRLRLDPPSASLEGLSITIYVDDSVGGTPYRTIFDDSADSCESVAEQIRSTRVTANMQGRIAVSCESGALRFEAVEPGPDVELGVAYGSALPILGFTERTIVTGEASTDQRRVSPRE
jgi:hypothetical protein